MGERIRAFPCAPMRKQRHPGAGKACAGGRMRQVEDKKGVEWGMGKMEHGELKQRWAVLGSGWVQQQHVSNSNPLPGPDPLGRIQIGLEPAILLL